MPMAFPLQNPFEMIPYPSNSLTLLHYHIKGVTSPNGFFNFGGPYSLYAAVYPRRSSSTTLSPAEVLVTPLPLNGTTPQHAMHAIMAFRSAMALRGSGGGGGSTYHQLVVEFCFLVPAEDSDQNYDDVDVDGEPNGGGKESLDLNLSPPYATATVTEFVGDIKTKNISKFTDDAVSYLIEHARAEEVAEYNNIMSNKSEAQIGNLNSIRIWNMLTLPGEIGKALAEKRLIEAPVRFPPPQELVPVPQQGWRDATGAADCNGDNETLIRNEKRKAVAAAGMDAEDESYPYDVPMKKPHHGGIDDEAEPLVRDKSPFVEAEGVYSDSDSD